MTQNRKDAVRQYDGSLAWTLHHLLTRHGADLPCSDLLAALGHATTIAVHAHRPPICWTQFAADANLLEAARVFGIHLRPLHPRRAARGLIDAPEYQGHFIDSYLPLIHRAVTHGEQVLAWQGWPMPHSTSWGLIGTSTDDGLGVSGEIPGVTTPVPLQTAAIQCYVVESVTPQRPAAIEMVRCSLDAARCVANEATGTDDWCTGAAAWEVWARRLERDRGTPALIAHRAFAETLRYRRDAAREWCTKLSNTSPQSESEPNLASAATVWTTIVTALTEIAAALPGHPETALRALEIGREVDHTALDALAKWAGPAAPESS